MEPNLNFSIINIDKSSGPTSYTISEFVKRTLLLKKTSHMGTLDPKVTGVLPITLGRACKLSGYFIKHDKSYIGIIHTHDKQDLKKLQKLIDKNFLGEIKQIPPNKSAVRRKERKRKVYEFKFLEESPGKRYFLFFCVVEGGTYIRKICSDLGEMINGAHMAELRRTKAGIFNEEKIYNLKEFQIAAKEYKKGKKQKLNSMLIPAEEAIKKVLPTFQIDQNAVKALYTGKPVFKLDISGNLRSLKKDDVFALFSRKKFIGIYKRTPKDIAFAKPEFVYN
tara:strand:- start:667 stop:1503 length:837 start_codon:yes stop_codon:yes gene_type:complete